MRRTKEYPDIIYQADMIERLASIFFASLTETSNNLSIRRDKESWSYDSIDEFLLAYREGFDTAYCTFANDSSMIKLEIYGNTTTIIVEHNAQSEIAKVFELAEKYSSEMISKTPQGEEGKVFLAASDDVGKNRFRVSHKIPSCHVTIKLLKNIENELIQYISKITDKPIAQLANDYSISISDVVGTETMKSIADYGLDRFIDSTQSITMDFNFWKLGISISLRFSSPTASEIDINVKDSRAREIATSILHLISRQIDVAKTWSFLLHGVGKEATMAMVTSSLLGVGIVFLTDDRFPNYFALYTVLPIFFWVARLFKPYISFDTLLQEKRDKLFAWFFSGFCSFAVFGCAFPFLNKFFLN